ncbi:MAG: DNA integrity scanning diadenylate cyclase DisA [Solirubrobacterales bacterium]|nr:DNA integrity scanning diadenylate cyclase DisA [Solirubrobacterales bacterium]
MSPAVDSDLMHLSERQDPRLLRAIYAVAPGTALREGIDNIVHARTGGLIVVGETEEFAFMLSGGIRLDIDYSPAMLYQVAKMDGAIVINRDASKISWANVQMMPDPTIHSGETGTRHRTAERISKQVDALVIAISQRRDVVSLYLDGIKYILQDIPSVLAKSNQALAALDKYRSRLDELSQRLTRSEFTERVVLYDALSVLQRSELVSRMALEVERYIVELGTEGRLIEMQLEETIFGVGAERSALIRDYSVEDTEQNLQFATEQIAALSHHELLDFGRLAEILGYDRKVNTLDFPIEPRGYRLLGEVPRLPGLVIQKIVHRFGSLDGVLASSDQELSEVDGVGPARTKEIREGVRRLQESVPADQVLNN